jgi:hypothetical protein
MKTLSFRLLPALFALAACSDDATSPDGGNGGDPEGRLQIVPGIAALPAVDVVVDGQVRLTNVAYGVPSSPLALSVGAHLVKVVAPGTGASAGGTTVNVRENDTTRVVVVGTPTAPNPVALGDTGATPVAGMGKLRVSHMAPNAPPIDVYRSQPDFPAFTKIMDPFPHGSASPFIQSTPGNWVIRVTAKGTEQVIAESAPIRVDALWIRTILLLDAPGGGVKITPLGEQ